MEQPDTWVRNKRNIFESVSKICCEIIESGWAKDRALVNTFIVGLASRIHEKNDYDEQVTLNVSRSWISHLSSVVHLIRLIIWPQVGREKENLTVPLHVIQLLTDISVAVKKPEVADMVFPFFIESLEEGDTSTPGSLRLQVWFHFK